jgi:hypothetical protein
MAIVLLVLVLLLPLTMTVVFWTQLHRRKTLSTRLHVKEYHQARAAVDAAQQGLWNPANPNPAVVTLPVGGGNPPQWQAGVASVPQTIAVDGQTMVTVTVCHEGSDTIPDPNC